MMSMTGIVYIVLSNNFWGSI